MTHKKPDVAEPLRERIALAAQDVVKVRVSPANYTDVIVQLPRGTEMQIRGSATEWLLIDAATSETQRVQGWVRVSDVVLHDDVVLTESDDDLTDSQKRDPSHGDE
jgi:hypothetical protein